MTQHLNKMVADAQDEVDHMRAVESAANSNPDGPAVDKDIIAEKFNQADREIKKAVNEDIRRDRPTTAYSDMLFNDLREKRGIILRRMDGLNLDFQKLKERYQDDKRELSAVNAGLELLG